MADGQQQIIKKVPEISEGIKQLNSGQSNLLAGFKEINNQMNSLSTGLDASVDGLSQVSGGMKNANSYLEDLSKSDTKAFNIPKEVLKSKEFKQVLTQYVSEDGKIMRLDVILADSPYSAEAMTQVRALPSTIASVLNNTKLENAQVEIGGVTSQNVALQKLSKDDILKTAFIMIAAIMFILALLFKEIKTPIYLVISLVLTYFMSMGINEWFYTEILHYEGLSWIAPFFSFVILMALGIDYSIFLMTRYKENMEKSTDEAMYEAMKKMGTVILSAIFILAGTFAAMIPSGMMSLIQIATITIIVLIMYALFMLPLFIPAMATIFTKSNKKDQPED
ncbi:MAG: MMPL family transporter [Kurthia sp.]